MEEDPLSGDITILRGRYQGSYRRRVGNWRVIFTLRPNQDPSPENRRYKRLFADARRPHIDGVGASHRRRQHALDLAAERAIGRRTKLIATPPWTTQGGLINP